jgi:hypothetical protein
MYCQFHTENNIIVIHNKVENELYELRVKNKGVEANTKDLIEWLKK